MIDEKIVAYIVEEINKSQATLGLSKENYIACADPKIHPMQKSCILATDMGYLALYSRHDDELFSGIGIHLFSLVCNVLLWISSLPPSAQKLFYEGIEFRRDFNEKHGMNDD